MTQVGALPEGNIELIIPGCLFLCPAPCSGCEVLALTLKLANGVVATIALDRTGTSAIERVLVVGDQARAEFEGDLLERPALTARVLRLQKVREFPCRPHAQLGNLQGCVPQLQTLWAPFGTWAPTC